MRAAMASSPSRYLAASHATSYGAALDLRFDVVM